MFFITGTDTGAGKTVLTALLARFLRERGVNVAALKPVCSGGRDDARALQAALGGALSLDEINPWHFRPPIAPVLAARRERKRVTLADVLAHVRAMQKRFDVVLIEGAGGLLSPLGENFDSRDLLTALRATPDCRLPEPAWRGEPGFADARSPAEKFPAQGAGGFDVAAETGRRHRFKRKIARGILRRETDFHAAVAGRTI